jgi:hypothetical protein
VGGEVTAKPICDHQFAKIIKRLAVRAGLSAASFSGHSLRSGIATSAAEGGATEHAIMEQTRHRSLKQVRKYIRRAACSKTMPPPRVACDPDGRPRLHSRCDRALPKPDFCGRWAASGTRSATGQRVPTPTAPAFICRTEPLAFIVELDAAHLESSLADTGFADLVARAVEVLGSRPQALAWLRTPLTGLNGLTPLQAMAGAEGRQEVEDVLGRIEHGAFG